MKLYFSFWDIVPGNSAQGAIKSERTQIHFRCYLVLGLASLGPFIRGKIRRELSV